MSQDTSDRLFDAIERARQEVRKSREVLEMHLTSSPASGVGSPITVGHSTVIPAATTGYGMGMPVTPPTMQTKPKTELEKIASSPPVGSPSLQSNITACSIPGVDRYSVSQQRVGVTETDSRQPSISPFSNSSCDTRHSADPPSYGNKPVSVAVAAAAPPQPSYSTVLSPKVETNSHSSYRAAISDGLATHFSSAPIPPSLPTDVNNAVKNNSVEPDISQQPSHRRETDASGEFTLSISPPQGEPSDSEKRLGYTAKPVYHSIPTENIPRAGIEQVASALPSSVQDILSGITSRQMSKSPSGGLPGYDVVEDGRDKFQLTTSPPKVSSSSTAALHSQVGGNTSDLLQQQISISPTKQSVVQTPAPSLDDYQYKIQTLIDGSHKSQSPVRQPLPQTFIERQTSPSPVTSTYDNVGSVSLSNQQALYSTGSDDRVNNYIYKQLLPSSNERLVSTSPAGQISSSAEIPSSSSRVVTSDYVSAPQYERHVSVSPNVATQLDDELRSTIHQKPSYSSVPIGDVDTAHVKPQYTSMPVADLLPEQETIRSKPHYTSIPVSPRREFDEKIVVEETRSKSSEDIKPQYTSVPVESEEITRLKELLQEREALIKEQRSTITEKDAVIRQQQQQLEDKQSIVHRLERELAELKHDFSVGKQEFAQQKANLLLKYNSQPQATDGSGLPPVTPPHQQPSYSHTVSSSNVTAVKPSVSPSGDVVSEVPSPNDKSGVKYQTSVPTSSSSRIGALPSGVRVVGRVAAGPRKPSVVSPTASRRSASRSRTPERTFSISASPEPPRQPIYRSTSKSSFAKRTTRRPDQTGGDSLMVEPKPTLSLSGRSTDPPVDQDACSHWKTSLNQRKKLINNIHPCIAPMHNSEIDLSTDVEVPPLILSGERKDVTHGLCSILTQSVNGGTALAFHNYSPDTQYNLRYIFSDGSIVKTVSPSAFERAPGDFGISVLPGETKIFVDGNTSSSKMSLSYGVVDSSAKLPRGPSEEILNDMNVIRKKIKPLGLLTAGAIQELCQQHQIPFVDLTFPPMVSSLTRDWCVNYHLHSAAIWAWRTLPTTVSLSSSTSQIVLPGSLSSLSVCEALSLCSTALKSKFDSIITSTSENSFKIVLRQNGWTHPVTIDNYFPINVSGEAMYAQPVGQDVNWCAPIEKALAKLKGTYDALQTCTMPEILEDLCGSHCEERTIPDKSINTLWNIMREVGNDVSFAKIASGERSDSGLVPNSHFVILETKELKTLPVKLVRLRSLSSSNWSGDWSAHSPLWTADVSVECNVDLADGSTWMSLEDFSNNFDILYTILSSSSIPGVTVAAAGYFDSGTPDTILQVTSDNQSISAVISLHQKDAAGLPSCDLDTYFAGLSLGVLCPQRDGSHGLCGLSNGGVYKASSAISLRITLPKGITYIVPQVYHSVSKAYVVTVTVSDISKLQFKFLQKPRLGKSSSAIYPTSYESINVKSLLATQQSRPYQIVSKNVLVMSGAGGGVRFQKGSGSSIETWGCVVRKPSRQSVLIDKGVIRITSDPQNTQLLEVIISSGKDLSVQGPTPACYCEVKLVRMNDQNQWISLPGTLRRTRYISNTSNPTWGEILRYSGISSDDYLFIKCFDRDLFSQDQMGELLFSYSELVEGLTVGGPPRSSWYVICSLFLFIYLFDFNCYSYNYCFT